MRVLKRNKMRDEDAARLRPIETRTAVAHIESIGPIEGVDGTIIAPLELSTEPGVSVQADAPDFNAAVARLGRLILAAGIPLGGTAPVRPEH